MAATATAANRAPKEIQNFWQAAKTTAKGVSQAIWQARLLLQKLTGFELWTSCCTLSICTYYLAALSS
jgi:hypothetical protein